MYKVIVFTHGELGKGLLNSARMVSGPVDDVESFSILPGIDTDAVLAEVEASVHKSEEAGVPVLLLRTCFLEHHSICWWISANGRSFRISQV